MVNWRNTSAWAVAAPIFCAVHCAAAPLLVLAVPALAPAAEAEAVLLALSAVLVGVVLARGFGAHRNPLPSVGAAVGLCVWGASLAGWFLPTPEVATTVAGSFAVAGAMLWNWVLTHRATAHRCACPACEPLPERSTTPAPVGR